MASGSLEMAKSGLQAVHCRSPGISGNSCAEAPGCVEMYDG